MLGSLVKFFDSLSEIFFLALNSSEKSEGKRQTLSAYLKNVFFNSDISQIDHYYTFLLDFRRECDKGGYTANDSEDRHAERRKFW